MELRPGPNAMHSKALTRVEMSLCQLMQMAFKGTNPEHIGFDIYDLEYGIFYAEGYLQEDINHDLIGDFDLHEFAEWCEAELNKRRAKNAIRTG